MQIDQRVGEHQIVFPDVLVVGLDILAEFRSVAGKVPVGLGHGHEAHVEKVWGATHHAATDARPVRHHCTAPLKVHLGARHNERQPYTLPRGR